MKIHNLQNETRKFVSSLNNFHVLEYLTDTSVAPENAQKEYYMSKMGVRRRQVVIELNGKDSAIIQSGAMQWTAGTVKATAGIKGVGDLFGKAVKGKLTNESMMKPEYEGDGILVLEPTHKYILLIDVGEWGSNGMTVEDGMFLASSGSVKNTVTVRKSISSAVLGKEGMFNIGLKGKGVAALESNVPYDELIEVELEDDELKIDGNMAVCWSSDLSFTVERSTKRLIGSAVSGEGLVNVYRGSGRVLMSPTAPTESLQAAALPPKPEEKE